MSSTWARAIFGLLTLVGIILGPGSSADAQALGTSESTVVLVSLDGFRADYLQRHETPHLDALAARGARADALVPVFPAKTFPGHYSIVTGLFPEHHGILSNAMYDPEFNAEFRFSNRDEAFRSRWWDGEPIWQTAQRSGLRTASFFWPGSEAEGRHPDVFKIFDSSIPFEERVDTVLEWLDPKTPERPRFVTLYFGEPNVSGHAHGPDSTQVAAAVRRVDGMIGRLVAGPRGARSR